MKKEFLILALVLGLIGCSIGCSSAPEATKNAEAPSAGDSGKAASSGSGKSASSSPSSPWGAFKVGSYVKTKTTTSMQVMGKAMDTSTESKTTLAELTADKAVLEVETTVAGNTSKTRMDMPLTAGVTPTANPSAGPAPAVKTGTDTVTVGGKTLDCKTMEVETEASGNKVNTKVWTSDQVPGAVVKSVSTTSGATTTKTTTEVTDFKAS
jgi:hypothetical protein